MFEIRFCSGPLDDPRIVFTAVVRGAPPRTIQWDPRSRTTSSGCSCPPRPTRPARGSPAQGSGRGGGPWLGALSRLQPWSARGCNPDDVVTGGCSPPCGTSEHPSRSAHPIAPVDGTVPVTGGDSSHARQRDRLTNRARETAESLNRGSGSIRPTASCVTASAAAATAPCRSRAGGRSPACHRSSTPRGPSSAMATCMGWSSSRRRAGAGLMPRYGDKSRGTDRWTS